MNTSYILSLPLSPPEVLEQRSSIQALSAGSPQHSDRARSTGRRRGACRSRRVDSASRRVHGLGRERSECWNGTSGPAPSGRVSCERDARKARRQGGGRTTRFYLGTCVGPLGVTWINWGRFVYPDGIYVWAHRTPSFGAFARPGFSSRTREPSHVTPLLTPLTTPPTASPNTIGVKVGH